uniref:hypothetical protein n=1 Tax=Candidatus Ichthyocystis sparus TaxID=1561004 RepID=UPI00159EF13A
QGIDGGFNGELLIATKEVATNENFINKTLEAHEIHPNSTILVPQIPLVSQNQNTTEKNYTLIQTPGKERFMVPLYAGHDQQFVGTLNYNNTKIALIKSTTPARSKRDLHDTHKPQPIKLHLVDPMPQNQKTHDMETTQLPQLQELFKEDEIWDFDFNPLLNLITARLSPGILVGLQMSLNSIGEWHKSMQLLGVGSEIWEGLQKNEAPENYIKKKLESLFLKYGTPKQRFFPVTAPETSNATEGSTQSVMWCDTINVQIFKIDWSLVKADSPIGETVLEKTPRVYQVIGYSQEERQLLYATALAKNTPLDLLASIPIGDNKENSNKALKFFSLQDMGNKRFLGKLWQSDEGKILYKIPPLPGIDHLMLLPQNKREDETPAVELTVPKEAMEYLTSITLVTNPELLEGKEAFPRIKFSSAEYTEFMGTNLEPMMIKLDGSDLIMEILKPKRNHSDPQEGPEYFITRFEQTLDGNLSLHYSCSDVITIGTKIYSHGDLQTLLTPSQKPDFDEQQTRDPSMEDL